MHVSGKQSSYLMAFTRPLPGKEAEYNAWYDTVHVKEVVAIPGIVSGRRFRLTAAQMDDSARDYPYLVVYEIEAGQEQAVLDRIRNAMPQMRIDPVIDMSHSPSFMVEALGDTWTG